MLGYCTVGYLVTIYKHIDYGPDADKFPLVAFVTTQRWRNLLPPTAFVVIATFKASRSRDLNRAANASVCVHFRLRLISGALQRGEQVCTFVRRSDLVIFFDDPTF